ncbi:WD repeat-containing protein 93 [Rhinophrynus dorsalis]
MPVYIRKGPLEIPPGSEKDWAREDQEEDCFINDPDQTLDRLPQPFRSIDKMISLLIDQAWEIISIREQNREAEKLKAKVNVYQPAAEIQITKRAHCMAVGGSGTYIFIGLSEGIAVYSLPNYTWICGWESTTIEIFSLSVCHVKNQIFVLATVDDMGIARLFYFYENNLNLLKTMNEPEDISKRTVSVTFQISHGGDYAGLLLQGSGECWLEVYRLPKDSWLKELDSSHTTLSTNAAASRTPPPAAVVLSETEVKLTPPVLLMKIKPPKALTGSPFKSPQEALQKTEDSSVFGTGQNHVISAHQWEQQESVFTGIFHKYLHLESCRTPEGERSRHTQFHFVQADNILQCDPERNQTALANAVSVHWNGCHNLLLYLLARPAKDKTDADPKPDIVWPCASAISCSAVSSCSSYIAIGLEDGTLTIWDIRYSGFPLAVVALPEEKSIGSLHFLECFPANRDSVLPNRIPAVPRAQILVCCTDNSLYLVTAAGGKESSLVLLQESSENCDQQISSVMPISSLPNAVLLFFRSGLVELMDVTTQDKVCQFGLPLSHKLAYPWQPVYTLDPENFCLFLIGHEKATADGILAAGNGACSLFAFSLNCSSLVDTFMRTQHSAVPPSLNLPWEQMSKIVLQKRQDLPPAHNCPGTILHTLVYWSSPLRGYPVCFHSENPMAVAYFNKQGGTRSASVWSGVKAVLAWVEEHFPAIFAVHIPWADNVLADHLSHQTVDPGEWVLHSEVLDLLAQKWGFPWIDLTAYRDNRRDQKFCSLWRDPLAFTVDALGAEEVSDRRPCSHHVCSLLDQEALVPRTSGLVCSRSVSSATQTRSSSWFPLEGDVVRLVLTAWLLEPPS